MQGGIYSLPIHSYSEVLYYNKTFFAEHGLSVPTTWDELVETCRAIRDITGAPAFGWDNLAGSFMTLLLQNGGRYTDHERQSVLCHRGQRHYPEGASDVAG